MRLAGCPPLLRNGLVVVGYNSAIAALLAAVGYGDGFWVNLVYSQCIGLTAWLLVDGGRRLIWRGRHSGGWIWLLAAAAITVASTAGVSLAALLLGHSLHIDHYLTTFVISGVAGLVAIAYFWEQAKKEEWERLAAEAQLRLLQAQIEPHFLFNTLANLHALIPADPKRAQAMLDHLNGYLRAALAAARKERNSLGDEFALLRGYLEILAIRMDRRLRYQLELPEALAAVELPPMLLQPLVENAIKHGLEPKIEGGEITVSAKADHGALRLRVSDSGLGLGAAPTAGTGAGIVQLRERLAAVYGGAASLELSANPAGGVTASLSLPIAIPLPPVTRALIAEDEPLLAAALKAALAQAWPELEVAALAANGVEALEAAARLLPEVAFLDIRMPGLNGLELAAELADRLGDQVPAIVFVTAHDEYALKAFDSAAVDYLLKPVSAERLARCVARLKTRLAKPRNVDDLFSQLRMLLTAKQDDKPLTVIRAGSGNAVRMIPLAEVCYFQAADKYTSVVTRDGEALIRTPLKELLAQLPRERFQQIHRGTVVNLQEVAAALRDDAGRVSLSLRNRKETLPVSRLYADLFRQM